MKDKKIRLSLYVLVSLYTSMVGCQGRKVYYYDWPDDYQSVKSIENRVFPTGVANADESNIDYDTIQSIPDYFDFWEAAKAYDNGRLMASHSVKIQATGLLSVYGETNLVAQAFRDGLEEQNMKNPAAIQVRNRIRRQRQMEFWGVYRNNGETYDDLTLGEEANMTTNCYVHLLSSYVKGYQNGHKVVAKLGKSPIVKHRGLAFVNLGAEMLKRAYVYGWYAACYDYFCADPKLLYFENVPPEGDPRSFYAFWLSFYREVEGRFLHKCAAKKEMVKEE